MDFRTPVPVGLRANGLVESMCDAKNLHKEDNRIPLLEFRYVCIKSEYIRRGLRDLTEVEIEFTDCVNGLTAALRKRPIDLLKKFTIVAL